MFYTMKDEKKIMLSEEQKLQLINEYRELCRYRKYSAIQHDLALSCIRAIEAGQKPKFSVKYIKDYVKKQQQHQIKTQNCEDSSRTYKETKAKLTAKEKQAKQDKKTLRKEQQLQAYRIRGEQECKKGCYIASDMARHGCIATLDNKQPPYSMFDITKESIKEEQCQIKTQGRKDLSCTYEEAKAEQMAKEKQAKKDEKTLQNERQLHAYHILTEQEYKKGCEKAHHMAHQSWQATLNNQNPPYSTFDIVKEGIKEELHIKNNKPKQTRQNRFLRSPQNNGVNNEDYYINKKDIATGKSKSQPQKPTPNRKNNIINSRIQVLNDNIVNPNPHTDTLNPMEQTVIDYTPCDDQSGKKITRLEVATQDMDKINQIDHVPALAMESNERGKRLILISNGTAINVRPRSNSEPKEQTNQKTFERQCQRIANKNIMIHQQMNNEANVNV